MRVNAIHIAEADIFTANAIQKDDTRSSFCKGTVLKTRCGINTGDIVVVAIGTKERLVFTVHGDDVNIAARLEPLNKEYGTYILASESTVKACSYNGCEFDPVGEVTVRGRSAPTKIFPVKGYSRAATTAAATAVKPAPAGADVI